MSRVCSPPPPSPSLSITCSLTVSLPLSVPISLSLSLLFFFLSPLSLSWRPLSPLTAHTVSHHRHSAEGSVCSPSPSRVCVCVCVCVCRRESRRDNLFLLCISCL